MEFLEDEMTKAINDDHLFHYGIKGMHWGIRRYQNYDGSLTSVGRKRLDSMSDDAIQKMLRKEVKNKRKEQNGYQSQWMYGNTIGENSKKAYDNYRNKVYEFHNSDAYKKAEEKIKDLNKRAEPTNPNRPSFEEYNKEYDSIMKSIKIPKELNNAVVYDNGKQYSEEYLKTYGSEQNIGYLKDMGFDDDAAKYLNSRILKANTKTIY